MSTTNEESDKQSNEPEESRGNRIDLSKIADPIMKVESTRSKIALTYVICFFVTILIVFIIGYLNCFKVDDYKDMLILVSGILSGPLGFIIGYYFKSSEKVNS